MITYILTNWILLAGIVKECDGDEAQVKVMRQKGYNSFNWPSQEDCISYEAIECIVKEPKRKGRHYALEQNDWEKYCAMLQLNGIAILY